MAHAVPATLASFARRLAYPFATIWRSKVRNEALIDQLRTGNHSPPRYRVLGPLANVPAFAQAFNCLADAPMMRAKSEQISIW
ncbi:MAG TPA: M13-type metalloendopeptidase [Burkholderiaceae bacterium]|nr:M13-type metalloendopeptidase [Burkholderiaceae bacterium]